MAAPDVSDHLRPVDGDHEPGTYRVVGSRADAVTLLRVADADGRRANTGEVVTVPKDDLDDFAPADDPDGNRPLRDVVTSAVETLYWSLRVFLRQLAAHPLPAALAMTLVLAGAFGDRFVALPGGVLDGLVVLGAVGLVYVGGGRLARGRRRP